MALNHNSPMIELAKTKINIPGTAGIIAFREMSGTMAPVREPDHMTCPVFGKKILPTLSMNRC
jgi:hypothetical protein